MFQILLSFSRAKQLISENHYVCMPEGETHTPTPVYTHFKRQPNPRIVPRAI